ncbi:Transposon TX1 uncharacterized 149 kDa protein, partial [Linum perenne]
MAIPRSVEVEEKEKSLVKDLSEEWRKEELFWGQRARNNWLRKGDKNTKLFHATTIQRMHRNRISQLKNRDGIWMEEEGELKGHVQAFFKELFTASENQYNSELTRDLPRVVTHEMNVDLTRPVIDEEVRKAVFDLGPNKSPGPDGFSGNFYRQYWDVLGPQETEEILKIPIGPKEVEDYWVWHHDRRGTYTVKSGYQE